MSRIGAVAIGRNEGERLRLCLESLVGRCAAVVYVDSGSADGSVDLARSLGVEVVDLDREIPFTAARARNAGSDRLLEIAPDIAYVQFVDGDCEVVDGWLDRATEEMVSRPDAAVVCGRRRERYPDRSIYNRLADLEWDTPIGESEACGGDALMRTDAYHEAGGYNPVLIAGEEPELCHRLRLAGWRVLRVDAEMTRHDLDMTRFGQWWRRQVRFGYAALDVTARHRGGPFARHVWRTRIWTAGWLIAVMSTAILAVASRAPVAAVACAIVAVTPAVQAMKVASRARSILPKWSDALAYGSLIVIGKWAEAFGQARYLRDRMAGRRANLIEYKPPLMAKAALRR
jgi:GT2 family glycosyltransferase